jgi:hypothetical protein
MLVAASKQTTFTISLKRSASVSQSAKGPRPNTPSAFGDDVEIDFVVPVRSDRLASSAYIRPLMPWTSPPALPMHSGIDGENIIFGGEDERTFHLEQSTVEAGVLDGVEGAL